MAGAAFSPYPAGPQTFRRVVLGGELKQGENFSGRRLGLTFPVTGHGGSLAERQRKPKEVELIEYTLRLPMRDASFASFAEADQLSRDLLWNSGLMDMAESLFQVPPDHVRSVKPAAGPAADAAAVAIDCLRPAGLPRLYVLGGCADVDRTTAAKLLRPLALIDLGTRVGQAAASEAEIGPRVRLRPGG